MSCRQTPRFVGRELRREAVDRAEVFLVSLGCSCDLSNPTVEHRYDRAASGPAWTAYYWHEAGCPARARALSIRWAG